MRNVDLNLLESLQALLEEQSVTRAAARMGLSQPAMSASLGKLRRHFDDELFSRNGNTYEPTPLARELVEPTRAALRAAHRVFDREPEFDASTSARDFELVMSDYSTVVLGPTVTRIMREESPASRAFIHTLSPSLVDAAPESMRTYDLMVLPHGFLTQLRHRAVYEDDWACIVSADNTAVGDHLTVEDLAELPWVLTFHQRTAFTTAAQQLRMQGIEPRVEVVTENFLTLGALISGTRRVALVQKRLGLLLATTGAVRVLPCPFAADSLVESIWWHPMHDSDKAHAWLRDVFIRAGVEIT